MPNYEVTTTIFITADSKEDAENIIETMVTTDPFISDFQIDKVALDYDYIPVDYDQDDESTILNTGGLSED